jgi:hypothetical protein
MRRCGRYADKLTATSTCLLTSVAQDGSEAGCDRDYVPAPAPALTSAYAVASMTTLASPNMAKYGRIWPDMTGYAGQQVADDIVSARDVGQASLARLL